MDDASFFDNIAPQWDENEVLSTPEKVNLVLDFMDIKPGHSVLDLGTGTGVLLPFLSQRIGRDGTITAVDYSQGMLNIAENKFSNLTPKPRFLKMDFENENLADGYDRIILYCVYPHLHTPIDTLKWLTKVNLKENGAIFIAFPCGPDFINNIHKEKHSHSDKLPSATDLTLYLKNNGLNAQMVKDEEEIYIIKIIK